VRFLDLSNLTSPPPRWLLPRWIARDGLNVLIGAGGAGKSYFACDLALALAGGERFLGIELERARVLYVDEDGPERILTHRIRTLAAGRGQSADSYAEMFAAMPAWGLQVDQPDRYAALVAAIALRKADFVILDALVALHSLNENDNRDMSLVMRGRLRGLMRETGCGILLLHHEGKPGEVPRYGPHLARGASEIINASDAALSLRAHEGSRTLSVVRSRLLPEAEWPAKLDYVILGETSDSTRLVPSDGDLSKYQRAFQMLRALPTLPATIDAAQAALGESYSRSTVARALAAAKAAA
jgi:hypothetical protein